MVCDAQPKGKLCGYSNGKRTWANKKQHAKDGKMFKINVSKMYIALAIAPIFLTNHVITNGQPKSNKYPTMRLTYIACTIQKMTIDLSDEIAKR